MLSPLQRRGLVGVVAQVIHDFLYGIADFELLLASEFSLRSIRLREHQGLHRDRIIVSREGLDFQLLLGLVGSLRGIASEKALVEAFFRF